MLMLTFSAATDPTDWSPSKAMTLYARFRSKSAITGIKAGVRGGLWAEIDGEWKRVRRTRGKGGKL